MNPYTLWTMVHITPSHGDVAWGGAVNLCTFWTMVHIPGGHGDVFCKLA